MKEANKIIFDFILKGKDKVKGLMEKRESGIRNRSRNTVIVIPKVYSD